MTIPTSTAPTVKAWLADNLATACTAEATYRLVVTYGDPQSGGDDYVTVGRVRRVVEPHAMVGSMGANSLREAYTVDVEIQSFRKASPVVAETRMYALLAQVETVIRQQLADVISAGTAVAVLGGNVWRVIPGEHEVVTEQTGDEKFWWSHTTYPVEIHAVI